MAVNNGKQKKTCNFTNFLVRVCDCNLFQRYEFVTCYFCQITLKTGDFLIKFRCWICGNQMSLSFTVQKTHMWVKAITLCA